MQRGKYTATANFERFQAEISERISKKGPITTGQIWELLKKNGWSYSYITYRFKEVMDQMVHDGRAERLGKGFWNILTPGQAQSRSKLKEIESRIQDTANDLIFYERRDLTPAIKQKIRSLRDRLRSLEFDKRMELEQLEQTTR